MAKLGSSAIPSFYYCAASIPRFFWRIASSIPSETSALEIEEKTFPPVSLIALLSLMTRGCPDDEFLQ